MVYNRLSCIELKDSINSRTFVKFMCKDKVVKLQRNKKDEYIQLTMCDRNKEQKNVRMFNVNESDKDMIQNGKVYEAAVDVKEYSESPEGYSCIIYNIQEINDDVNDYIEWENGVTESIEYINKTLSNISEYEIFNIVYSIVYENWARFTRWAAASSIHHSKLGGLVVHTAEVIRTAESIAEIYIKTYGEEFIDINLVRATALLHDIGKCYELDTDVVSGTVSYSNKSALETHIMWILSEIDRKATVYNLTCEEVLLLKHCVASHHGKLEYGSPIEPSMPEAVIVSYADKLSADMYISNRDTEGMEEGTSASVWSSGKIRSVYKPDGR